MRKATLILSAVATALLLIILALLFQNPARQTQAKLSLTAYLGMQSRVRSATIRGDELTGRDDTGKEFTTTVPSGPAEATRLAEKGAEVTLVPAAADTTVATYVVTAVNVAWLIAALWYFRRIARALEGSTGLKRGEAAT